MPATSQQQVGSRGRCAALLLPLLLLSVAPRPGDTMINIPSNCEYRILHYIKCVSAWRVFIFYFCIDFCSIITFSMAYCCVCELKSAEWAVLSKFNCSIDYAIDPNTVHLIGKDTVIETHLSRNSKNSKCLKAINSTGFVAIIVHLQFKIVAMYQCNRASLFSTPPNTHTKEEEKE